MASSKTSRRSRGVSIQKHGEHDPLRYNELRIVRGQHSDGSGTFEITDLRLLWRGGENPLDLICHLWQDQLSFAVHIANGGSELMALAPGEPRDFYIHPAGFTLQTSIHHVRGGVIWGLKDEHVALIVKHFGVRMHAASATTQKEVA